MAKRKIYSSADIEMLKNRGITKLEVAEHDTITSVAQETAHKLGITITYAPRYSSLPSTSYYAERRPTLSQMKQKLIQEATKVLADVTPQQAVQSPVGLPAQPQVSAGPEPTVASISSTPSDVWMFNYRTFLDTADVAQIRDAVSTGLIDGVATNPEKVAQSGKSYRQVVEEIRQFFDGPIAVQAVGRSTEEVCECARRLHSIDPLLAIKITANKVGLAAVKILVPEGIRTNATLIFNPTQGFLAGLAGSPFISPFIGRARMTGYDGITTIGNIREILDAFGLNRTNLIAASIKDVEQVIAAILAGAHSVAVPFHVFEAMCNHPLTGKGLDDFIEIYKTIPPS
jgi:transaldolase